LLFGDESAIPAIGQLIEVIPAGTSIAAVIEVSHPDARVALPDHPASIVEWLQRESGSPTGDRLVRAVEGAHLSEGTRLWAAGEAAAMHRIRQNLFQERAIERSRATVRGYWKLSMD
ncbi:MAG: siderophore-interacting protein, partial [Acidimicrobiia bacterium]